MHYKYQEVVFGGMMLLVGMTLFWHTFADQYQGLLTGDHYISSMFYPRLILSAWCAMATGMIVSALKIENGKKKDFSWKNVLIALLMIAGLLVLINYIGFVISSAMFFFFFAVFLGYKRKWIAVMTAIIIPYLIYLVFDKLLTVSLPAPIWQMGG